MASEPSSSSSSAGSFDDDRLPLHTIGHATRHTLPPRTHTRPSILSPVLLLPFLPVLAPHHLLCSRGGPHRDWEVLPFLSYLSFFVQLHATFRPSFFHSLLTGPTPLPPFLLLPLSQLISRSDLSLAPSDLFSFPFLRLEAPSPFFNEIEIAMESVARAFLSFHLPFSSPVLLSLLAASSRCSR